MKTNKRKSETVFAKSERIASARAIKAEQREIANFKKFVARKKNK